MDKQAALRCPDCGALNDENALDCAECGLSVPGDLVGQTTPLPWIDALPGWVRWMLALPVIAIAGAVAVRALLFAGIDNSPGLIFPFAVAVAILASAVWASRVAPSHGWYVGVAVAVADAIVFIAALLFKFYDASPPSDLNVVLYAAGGVAGVGAAAFTFSRGVTSRHGGSTPELFADLGSRTNWALGILRSLFPATALGAMCAFVSAMLPRYVPMGVTIDLSVVLVPAVTVTAIGVYAPARNLLASRIVAGIFYALGATSLIYTMIVIAPFLHYPAFAQIFGFDATHGIIQAIGLICGATVGMDAANASIKSPLKPNATSQVPTSVPTSGESV